MKGRILPWILSMFTDLSAWEFSDHLLWPSQLYADLSHHLSLILCVNCISEDKLISWSFSPGFFWWRTENSTVWVKKPIFILAVKFIKTMLFHCTSSMVLRVYKQLLFLVKWNTVQQYFNSLLPDYQLFQESVKITGKMNYVLFVKLAPTCPSSWAGKDSLTVQHRCYCLWLQMHLNLNFAAIGISCSARGLYFQTEFQNSFPHYRIFFIFSSKFC